MVATVSLVREAPQVARKNRTPSHTFYLETKPFQIQPCVIAPVLPGETLHNLQLQARVATDPLKNKLQGWWKEYYFFYVKLRDLHERDSFTDMMLDPTFNANVALGSGEDTKMSMGSDINKNSINYSRMCLRRIVEEYFRDEGEAWDNHMVDGLPLAKINYNSWLDSIKTEAQLATYQNDEALPGEFEQVLPDSVPPGFETHYTQWEHMRALKLTEATFEDYLKSYGVRVPKAEAEDTHRPELIRYVRDWTYPSNTVDPASGGTTSACVWSVAERADKARFFKEPGFIFGVTVTRPKVYISYQWSNLVAHMDNAYAWLPAVLNSEPYTSLKKFGGAGSPPGPLARNGGYDPGQPYWVDMKDLFLHGDQFINRPIDAATPINFIEMDLATVGWQYDKGNIVDRYFRQGGGIIREDGVCNLVISGRLHETT